MYGIIYVTVNKVNGKKYIGQHKCLDEFDDYLGSGKTLKAAIRKYGKENFERYTLYRAESEEELDQKEIEFISAFRATHRNDYYNINEGGNANRMCGESNPNYGKCGDLCPTSGENHWHYGQHWSDEVKQKISAANKGKQGWAKGKERTLEHCKHISEGKKGKKPNFSEEDRQRRAKLVLERNQTEKFKEQVSDANRKFHENGGRRGNKPVVCVETGVVYISAYDAARAVGCGKSSISACFSGSCKTVKGFHWRYATPDEFDRAVIV